MTFRASGEVGDYTTSIVTAIRETFANAAGTDARDVEVSVFAGSVIVDVNISADTQETAESYRDAVKPMMKNSSTATAFLATVIPGEVTSIEQQPLVAAVDASAMPALPTAGQVQLALLAGIVAIVVCSILGLVGLFVICCRNGQQKQKQLLELTVPPPSPPPKDLPGGTVVASSV